MIELSTGDVPVVEGCSVNLQVVCEHGPFRMRRLIVPPEVGSRFLVTDIKVGKHSQLHSPGAVPASFFTAENQPDGLFFDPLPRGGFVTISVTCSKSYGDSRRQPRPRASSWVGRILDRFRSPRSTTEPAIPLVTFSALLQGDAEEDLGPTDMEREVIQRRHVVVGLGSTLVRHQSHSRILVQSSVGFRPSLLVIPPEVMGWARIVSMRVVGEDVIASNAGAAMPINAALDYGKSRAEIACRVVQVNDWLAIDLVNESEFPRFFSGTVAGRVGKK